MVSTRVCAARSTSHPESVSCDDRSHFCGRAVVTNMIFAVDGRYTSRILLLAVSALPSWWIGTVWSKCGGQNRSTAISFGRIASSCDHRNFHSRVRSVTRRISGARYCMNVTKYIAITTAASKRWYSGVRLATKKRLCHRLRLTLVHCYR